jgi:hypothetical protein
MRFRLALVLCVALGVIGLAQGTAPFNDSIRLTDLRAEVSWLAADAFRGRFVGTSENLLAAEFIRSRFERAGLAPGGTDGTYFQSTRLMGSRLADGNTLQATLPNGETFTYQLAEQFYPLRFSPSASARARLVYAGFGIQDPGRVHDDYAASVKGSIVLVLEHEPGERDPASPFDGLVAADSAEPIRKALLAQAMGATGVLFVADVHNHPAPPDFAARTREYWPERQPRLEPLMLASWTSRLKIPVAQISPALAASFAAGTGRTLLQLSGDAETPHGMAAVPLDGVEIALTTAVTRRAVSDRNVLAYIEGADPAVKDDVVLVSAHYDHEGADGALVYSGADDNASGTAALLEVAEAYGMALAANLRPRRTVLFAGWGAEERGPLLGSWAYVEQPRFPLERTIAVLNMDMIGRNEEVLVGADPRFDGLDPQTAHSNRNSLNVIGSSRAPALSDLIDRVNREGYGLELKHRYDNNPSNLLRRSDHWPFLQRGVPALWLSTGLHPDYHTRFDRPERLNYEKLQTIARLVHQVSWELANQDGRLR